MENNYQQNPYNTNQGYPQQPTQANPYGTQANPYGTQPNPYGTQANPYATQPNPYATAVPETPAYTDPYAPAAPAYADPYATTTPAYSDPYGTPAPAPAPKKSKKGLIIGLIAGAVIIIGVVVAVLLYFNSDSYKYGAAKDLMNEGKYDEAITAFNELGNYKDSRDLADECNYKKAESLFEEGNYEEAREIFVELEDYEESQTMVLECDYQQGCALMSEGNYEEASEIFEGLYYKDSNAKFIESNRRMLYEYLDDNGSVYYYYSDYTYELSTTSGGKIKIYREYDNTTFDMTFDMTSDSIDFYYVWHYIDSTDTDTTRGECVISELTTYNTVEVDTYTGDTYMMDELTKEAVDDVCVELDNILDETYLGLTPSDIGFTNLY